jgi:hypothetical protein
MSKVSCAPILHDTKQTVGGEVYPLYIEANTYARYQRIQWLYTNTDHLEYARLVYPENNHLTRYGPTGGALAGTQLRDYRLLRD